MQSISQRLNRLMYVLTLLLFLIHPLNMVCYVYEGHSLFWPLSKLLPYSKGDIALASLLIFPAYLILRWVLTGRFTIKPN
mgnify:CR=1 FL=1